MSSSQEEKPFDAAAFQADLDRSLGLTLDLVQKLLPKRPDGSAAFGSSSVNALRNGRATPFPFELRPERLGLGATPKVQKPIHPAEQRLQGKLAATKSQNQARQKGVVPSRALVDYGSGDSDEEESRTKAFSRPVPPPIATAGGPASPARKAGSPNPFTMPTSEKKRKLPSASPRGSPSLPASPKVPYRPDVSPTASADEGIDMPGSSEDDDEDDGETKSSFSSPSKDPSPTVADADGRVQKKRKRKRRRKKSLADGVIAQQPTGAA